MRGEKKRTSIWGPKRPTRSAADVIEEADRCLFHLKTLRPMPLESVASIRNSFIKPGHSYYALAALSRRNALTEIDRSHALRKLFGLRSQLERCMLESIEHNATNVDIMRYAAKPSFFGRSIKQGVSIRYPLATCVPTKLCGGLCYAHDGRDRDLQRLFRGALNWYLGNLYELGAETVRRSVMSSLSAAIGEAIAAARSDRDLANMEGYKRSPRIRFSHVGDMAETPEFANALAQEIGRRAPDIRCVIYTRHPSAKLFDSKAFIINFTVDGEGDSRISYKPPNARLVSSSWDGKLLEHAEINFIEHHVEKTKVPSGKGQTCPVTLNHDVTPSCDSARCEKCFVAPLIGGLPR